MLEPPDERARGAARVLDRWRTTDTTCGDVTNTNATIDYGEGAVLSRQRIADLHSISGDRGGAISYGNLANGVLSGITCDPDCDSQSNVTGTIYSHIVHAQNAMGVTVYTG